MDWLYKLIGRKSASVIVAAKPTEEVARVMRAEDIKPPKPDWRDTRIIELEAALYANRGRGELKAILKENGRLVAKDIAWERAAFDTEIMHREQVRDLKGEINSLRAQLVEAKELNSIVSCSRNELALELRKLKQA